MARNTGRNAKNGKGKDKEQDPDIPEGFDIVGERQNADGWLVKNEGVILVGRLKGYFTMEGDDAPRVVYQIEVGKDCEVECVAGAGDEAETLTLGEGKVVNADGAALQELERYATNGGVYDVFIKYIGKRKVGKGQMWDAKVRLREVKPPTRAGSRIVKGGDTSFDVEKFA